MLMKKMIKYFNDMKFRYKLIVTYTLIAILPITIMGIIWYKQSNKILINHEKSNIQNYLMQAVSNMDNQIRIYNNLSDYICFNQPIINVISHDYESYYDMYDQFTNIIDPMLTSMRYFHSDVKQVTIYTEDDIVKHNSTIAPLSEIENEKWYFNNVKNNTDLNWIIYGSKEKSFLVRQMPISETYKKTGVLYVEVDYNKLFQSFKLLEDSNYGVLIEDESGIEIFNYSNFDEENSTLKLNFHDYKKLKENDHNYMIVKMQSENKQWNIIFYKPQKLIYKSTNPMIIGTIIAVFICLVLSIAAASVLSKVMVSKLEKLRENMENVENGKLEINVRSTSKDEVGALIRGFSKMITQIKTLIEDVYESRIIQKDYEMKALQSQINPHFLYNTLSLINWMALEAGQKEISKIILSLSTFYRTALNKGKNILLVRDEIKNVRSYLDIQLMMHDYEFDADINIDDDILDYKILNLILQPLIENAINHGIDLKTDGSGIITITGKKDNNDIILTVADNGVGMDKEVAESILTNNSKGYGVKNVNERIKLYYGVTYDIDINSIVGQGTTIVVRIPIKE